MQLLSTETLNELRNRGISCLYHVTDRSNLGSISSCGGLGSWDYISTNGISVPSPGGDAVTHRLDRRRGVDHMVHLYLQRPNETLLQSYVLSGRASNPFVLEIEIDALKPGTKVGTFDAYAKNVNDEESSNDIDLGSQSILYVPGFIPLKFMRNMPEKYTANISSSHTTAVIFILDQSESMSQATEIGGVDYEYMSDAVAMLVNRQIEAMIDSCVEDGVVTRKYDIAVIGYGDYPYSAWSGQLSGKGFVSPALLNSLGQKGDVYRWVEPTECGRESRSDLAFEHARSLLEEWMSNQKNSYYDPPTVIHITDGGIPKNRMTTFLLESEAIKRLHTSDGNVLIWNFIIRPAKLSELILPSGDQLSAFTGDGLELYESSSVVPEAMSQKLAMLLNIDPRLPRRSMGLNVSLETLSKILGKCIFPDQL